MYFIHIQRELCPRIFIKVLVYSSRANSGADQGRRWGGGGGGGVFGRTLFLGANFIHFLYKVLGQRSVQK